MKFPSMAEMVLLLKEGTWNQSRRSVSKETWTAIEKSRYLSWRGEIMYWVGKCVILFTALSLDQVPSVVPFWKLQFRWVADVPHSEWNQKHRESVCADTRWPVSWQRQTHLRLPANLQRPIPKHHVGQVQFNTTILKSLFRISMIHRVKCIHLNSTDPMHHSLMWYRICCSRYLLSHRSVTSISSVRPN